MKIFSISIALLISYLFYYYNQNKTIILKNKLLQKMNNNEINNKCINSF